MTNEDLRNQGQGPLQMDHDEIRILEQEFELVAANGLQFFVDTKGSPLAEGESRVYPYHDEGTDLLRIARALGQEFDVIVDAFAGGGHSLLPILNAGIAGNGYGRDINPRAIRLAEINTALNGLDSLTHFEIGDVRNGLPRFEGPTLYIANPPFALPAQGVEMDRMRDGGHDGLALTLAFINQATIDVYIEQALRGAKPGDVIIGVAYSRIGMNGLVELEEELKKLAGQGNSFIVGLVEGTKLWRGANGKKEQSNPMNLEMMFVKAEPGPDYDRQVEEYRTATKMHREEGYDRLGYFEYVVRVGRKAGA